MWFAPVVTAASMALLGVVSAAPLNDIIHQVPLYGRPPTPMFSGYLDATNDGCDMATNGPICKLHYWLALGEDNDDGPGVTKPVVLWMNGGPGSSSLLGLLQEVGPLLMNATGGLMNNPWGWTRIVNLLILESPLGVGFSYCSRQVQGKPCVNTDQYTAKTNRAALVDFFTNKFPELAGNDFFITGESYAGKSIHRPQSNDPTWSRFFGIFLSPTGIVFVSLCNFG
jgi:carboxypeptidase C (cathepsin A)